MPNIELFKLDRNPIDFAMGVAVCFAISGVAHVFHDALLGFYAQAVILGLAVIAAPIIERRLVRAKTVASAGYEPPEVTEEQRDADRVQRQSKT